MERDRDDEDIHAEYETGCREAAFGLEALAAMAAAAHQPGADRWLPFTAPWRPPQRMR